MISIIIPFYNEKENLPTLIEHLIEASEKLNQKYEIILVDDGSTDDWRHNFQDPNSKIQIIQHKNVWGRGRL